MLKTTLCHQLGIESPLFSAGMGGGISEPELAAAVSNAGACGVARHGREKTVYSQLFDIGWADAPHRVLRNKAVAEWEAAGRPPTGKRPGEGTVVGNMRLAGAVMDVVRYAVSSPKTGFTGDLDYSCAR